VRFLLSFIICLFAVNPAFSQGGAVDSVNNSALTSKSTYKQNLSSEDAVEAALLYTGLSKQKELKQRLSASATVESTIAVDSTTPFLSDQISGRESWIVKFPSVDLAKQLSSKKTFPPKDIEILLDKNTGQILRMVGRSVELDTNVFRLPTANEAEYQLKVLQEEYQSFPEEPPQIDLIEALRACDFYPLLTYDFIASYVTYKYQDRGPILAWIVYMRSSEPICGLHYSPDEIYKVSNRRTIVSAITGERLFTVNLPFPLIEGYNKKEENLKDKK